MGSEQSNSPSMLNNVRHKYWYLCDRCQFECSVETSADKLVVGMCPNCRRPMHPKRHVCSNHYFTLHIKFGYLTFFQFLLFQERIVLGNN